MTAVYFGSSKSEILDHLKKIPEDHVLFNTIQILIAKHYKNDLAGSYFDKIKPSPSTDKFNVEQAKYRYMFISETSPTKLASIMNSIEPEAISTDIEDKVNSMSESDLKVFFDAINNVTIKRSLTKLIAIKYILNREFDAGIIDALTYLATTEDPEVSYSSEVLSIRKLIQDSIKNKITKDQTLLISIYFVSKTPVRVRFKYNSSDGVCGSKWWCNGVPGSVILPRETLKIVNKFDKNNLIVPAVLSNIITEYRGSCGNEESEELIVKIFNLLHSRFKNTTWAKETKYRYNYRFPLEK
jgi:hypothetical protein